MADGVKTARWLERGNVNDTVLPIINAARARLYRRLTVNWKGYTAY